MNAINICQLLGEDIRTRSRAFHVREALKDGSVTALDFSDVIFITRSFADELYTIVTPAGRPITLVGMQGEVKDIYEVVCRARTESRVHAETDAEVMSPASLNELENILLANA